MKLLDAGDLKPGDIVTQRELVSMIGQPLGAVREMIPRLAAEGLDQTVPIRGLQVCTVNIEFVRETFQLCRFIEREPFVNSCERPDTDELPQMAADDRVLRAEAVAGGTLFAKVFVSDMSFHRGVVDATGNRLLEDVHRVNQIKIRMIRNADPERSAVRMTAVLDAHLAII